MISRYIMSGKPVQTSNYAIVHKRPYMKPFNFLRNTNVIVHLKNMN